MIIIIVTTCETLGVELQRAVADAKSRLGRRSDSELRPYFFYRVLLMKPPTPNSTLLTNNLRISLFVFSTISASFPQTPTSMMVPNEKLC